MNIAVIDLFCGVGGLTCGLEKAGLHVVAGYDVDKECEYPYSYNNKAVFINKNIEEITGREIKKLLRGYQIKVLVGCAPCQPFSRHQKDKKNRKKHKDWSLLYQYSRIISEVRPHIVSMENVPELKHEKVFQDFVDNLVALGYNVEYNVINAANYGVPQNRRRLILLASRIKKIHLIRPNFSKPKSVKDAIGRLPNMEAGKNNKKDRLHTSPHLSQLNLQRIRHSSQGGTWREWPEELRLTCHKKNTGRTYSSVYGRMMWDQPAPTITTQFTCYGTGRFGHPEQDRAITLREGALLQSFPLNYVFIKKEEKINFKKISRYIGNAVPPRLGEIIGLSIQEHLRKRKYFRRIVNAG